MKNHSPLKLVLLLSPFVLSFSFGLDIYIPVIPEMTTIFSTTPAMIQLTLSLFLLSSGVGQLAIGPFCDHYGRKKTYYCSSLVFSIGNIICAFSHHVAILLGGRILSSFGACGMLIAAFATIRDLFNVDQSARTYSFLNGLIGISPTFAPIFGSYLAHYFGWRSVFLFLAFIGFAAFTVAFLFIDETNKSTVKMDKTVFFKYLQILQNKNFIIFASLAGLAEGVFFGFFSTSPFILIEKLSVPAHQFGYYFAIFGAVIGLGGLLGGKLLSPGREIPLIQAGIILIFLGGLMMLGCHYVFALSLWGYLLPMVVSCLGAVLILGSAISIALEPFALMAGTASAMLGVFQFGLSALVGSLVMLFPPINTVPYGLAILCVAFCSTYLLRAKNTLVPK